jgi:hypothetical protein
LPLTPQNRYGYSFPLSVKMRAATTKLASNAK